MKAILVNKFAALGLNKHLTDIVEQLGFDEPTPIQRQAIPFILEGMDVLGMAQTGTGKTAAFGLPIIHQMMIDYQRPGPKCAHTLILAPTRELVNQIADNLRQYVKKTPIWVSTVIGGASINAQIKHLQRGTGVLVATPGRLLDLCERNAINLKSIQHLVLDEADQMLDLGFIHALRKISKLVGEPRQTLLFSATMPKQVETLAQSFLVEPERVAVSPPGTPAAKIRQQVQFVAARAKPDLLKEHLGAHADQLSLVFARTKHGAEKLKKHLVECGFAADSVHGNKTQGQRERALKAFRSGEVNILVATDVAARGIDIPGVSHVYNYQLPEVPENYVHRIGRTARAGAEGEAIAFCAPDEKRLLKQIEKLLGRSIPVIGEVNADASSEADTAEPGKPAGKKKKKPHRKGFNPTRGPTRKQRNRKQRQSDDEIEVAPSIEAKATDVAEQRKKPRRPERRGEKRGDKRATSKHSSRKIEAAKKSREGAPKSGNNTRPKSRKSRKPSSQAAGPKGKPRRRAA